MDAVSVLALGIAAKGGKGEKGDKGDPGVSMTVGTTTTGEAGTQASVTNTGTTSDPILNFTIPKGDKGDKGDTGEQGIQGPKGDTGSQGPKGDTGPKGDKGDKGDTGLTGPQGPAGRDGAIQYTAGTNITISDDNVISATGGGGISFEVGDGLQLEDDVLSLDENYVTENVVAQGAYQLMSNDGQLVEGEFISRTTGGSASINSGDATHIYFRGNSVNTTATSASAVIKDQTEETKATLNSETFIAKAVEDGKADGDYEFTADDADYGVSLNGDASVTITFTNTNLGTIVNATPTSFTSIGFNAYDHANTRAYVIAGNRYQVFGAYTSIAGQTIEINKEVGSYIIPYSFVATTTGYVNVEGGNDTDTMIALVWSGYNYDHEYEAYAEDTIAISGLPEYGMPRVNGVYDEIDFSRQKYVHRIGRDVVANKDNYSNKIYDSTYVYYVLDVQTESAITIDEKYLADDFGTELFTGTTVPVGVVVIYGANLKDKLRTDVLTKSAQTLSDDEKNQVKANIGLPYQKITKNGEVVLPRSQKGQGSASQQTSVSISSDKINFVKNSFVGQVYTITVEQSGETYVGQYEVTGFDSNGNEVKAKKLTEPNVWFNTAVGSIGTLAYVYTSSGTLYWYKGETGGSYYVYITITADQVSYENKLSAKNAVDGVGIYIKREVNTSEIYSANSSSCSYDGVSIGRCSEVVNNRGIAIGNYACSGMDSFAGGSDAKAKARASVAIGSSSSVYNSANYGLALVGGTSYRPYCIAIGSETFAVEDGAIAIGKYNKYLKNGEVKNPSAGVEYNVGDVAWYNDEWYHCIKACTLPQIYWSSSGGLYDTTLFAREGTKFDYQFMIGNGTGNSARSNALTVDWNGNIECNNIPACPTDDGTYNLQVSIVDGVPTYSWVSVS